MHVFFVYLSSLIQHHLLLLIHASSLHISLSEKDRISPLNLLFNLKKNSTLSVVHTTLSVVYIIYSVSCKHLPSRLYTPQGQLCALFNQFHFQKKTGSLLLPCFLISKKKKIQLCRLYTLLCQFCTLFTRSVVNIAHTTRSVVYII